MATKLDHFRRTVGSDAPPADLPPLLTALWLDASGAWDAAHEIAQAERSGDGALVHGYLHRVEGDSANAAYWYAKAGEDLPDNSLEEEWERIAGLLLAR